MFQLGLGRDLDGIADRRQGSDKGLRQAPPRLSRLRRTWWRGWLGWKPGY